jgi:hypothetical protein
MNKSSHSYKQKLKKVHFTIGHNKYKISQDSSVKLLASVESCTTRVWGSFVSSPKNWVLRIFSTRKGGNFERRGDWSSCEREWNKKMSGISIDEKVNERKFSYIRGPKTLICRMCVSRPFWWFERMAIWSMKVLTGRLLNSNNTKVNFKWKCVLKKLSQKHFGFYFGRLSFIEIHPMGSSSSTAFISWNTSQVQNNRKYCVTNRIESTEKKEKQKKIWTSTWRSWNVVPMRKEILCGV